ncbi:MAG: Wzz/FepE/Etk N-terminal domain-containing protein, partial [Rikenellaceae bacterium]
MDNTEKEIDLVELMQCVWAKKRMLIKWGVIGLVIGTVVAFSMPKTYLSTVKIAAESKKGGGSMGAMGGLAAMAGFNIGGVASDGISEELYPEILQSTPFLLELVPIVVENNDKKISFYEYITKDQKQAWWSHVMGAPMSF